MAKSILYNRALLVARPERNTGGTNNANAVNFRRDAILAGNPIDSRAQDCTVAQLMNSKDDDPSSTLRVSNTPSDQQARDRVALAVASDAYLVEEPVFSPDIAQLERANVRNTLSRDATRAGRKTASLTFRHEVRGSGRNFTSNYYVGGGSDQNAFTSKPSAPLLGRLLEFCGMGWEARAITVGNFISVEGAGTASGFELGNGSITFPGARPRRFRITLSNPSGNQITPSWELLAEGGLPGATGSGPAIATSTFTQAGGYTINARGVATFGLRIETLPTTVGSSETWEFDLLPAAHVYKPVSDLCDMKSATMYLFYDGILHRMTGVRGTWSLEASGADYARYSFTFTGDYHDPIDYPLPTETPGYDNPNPTPVELAQLAVSRAGEPTVTDLAAQQFTVDIANEVAARESINADEAYAGSIITARNPVGTFNPEAVPEDDYPFWGQLSGGDSMNFRAVIGGTGTGNTITHSAPTAQITEISYSERNGLRVYDVSLQFATAGAGDDEIEIAFS